MCDVTQILQQIESGDPSAAEHLLPLVYEELRRLAAARMAREAPDHTLQATALVHDAWKIMAWGMVWLVVGLCLILVMPVVLSAVFFEPISNQDTTRPRASVRRA